MVGKGPVESPKLQAGFPVVPQLIAEPVTMSGLGLIVTGVPPASGLAQLGSVPQTCAVITWSEIAQLSWLVPVFVTFTSETKVVLEHWPAVQVYGLGQSVLTV